MTVLDTFFLAFKTDSSGARNDVAALDKQISNLAEKGKKRNEEENKQLKALRKLRQETTKDLKDQQKVVETSSNSFVKMAESATAAATALFSFAAIKSGVMNAQQLNSSLEVQSKLMRQNAGDMRAYAAATEAAGGSQEGFLNDYVGIFKSLSASGLNTPDPKTAMAHIRQVLKGYTTAAGQELAFQRLGISDPGLKSLALQSDSDYQKSIASAEKHARLTHEDAEAAREFGKVWAETSQSLSQAFTHLGTEVFPILEPFLKGFSSFLDSLRDHEGSTEAFFTAAALGAGALASGFTKLALSILGVGNAGKAVTAGAGSVGLLGGIGSLFAAWDIGKGIGEAINNDGNNNSFTGQAADWVAGKIVKHFDKPGKMETSKNLKESYDYWIAQGYTAAQAAGLVGNEKGESGGNPNAVGDLGTAHGIAQWHNDRRRKIKEATGIDVADASHADQLKAQAWEMKQMGITPQTLPNSEAGSADYITRKYERPANPGKDSMIRAGYAAQIAKDANFIGPTNNSSSNSTVNVKIDDVNVHTQATDADGIAKAIDQNLQKHIRGAISNIDDGISG